MRHFIYPAFELLVGNDISVIDLIQVLMILNTQREKLFSIVDNLDMITF